MRKMREKYNERPDLLAITQILREEQQSDKSIPFVSEIEPSKMRDLPGFLEPIAIRLRYDPKAPAEAYRVFGQEVLLCHRSEVLWTGDDYKTKCTYWPDFKIFAQKTEKRLGRTCLRKHL